MPDLDTAIDWAPRGPSRFEGQLTGDWLQGRGVFGGLLAAAALKGLQGQVAPDRSPRSLHATFLAPVKLGPVTLEAVIQREGRAVSVGEARISQGGALCAQLTVAFGAARPSRVVVAGPPPPALPAPDDLPVFPYLEGITPVFTQHYQYRFALGGLPFSSGEEAKVGGWFRPADPGAVRDPALVGMLDAWPAPALCLYDRVAPASTLAWSIHWAAPLPAEGVPAEGWWRLSAVSAAAGDGYADAEADLWDPSGRLVARARQLVALFA